LREVAEIFFKSCIRGAIERHLSNAQHEKFMKNRRIVKSWSNGILISAAAEFVKVLPESVVLLPTRMAGEGLAQRLGGFAGVHAITLVEFAADLARPAMATRGLGPLSRLGREAVAARVAHAAGAASELRYFAPVAGLPGFARALANTIGELRLTGVRPGELINQGEPGQDLASLLARYESELAEQRLVDLAGVLALATKAARESRHRLLDLPLVALDAPLDTRGYKEFFASVADRAPQVLVAVLTPALAPEPGDASGVELEDLDAQATGPGHSLEHLRRFLFAVSTVQRTAPGTPPLRPTPNDGRFQIFSAPGEGLESIEIARRILRLAHPRTPHDKATPFDQVAILLRNPERYQPMVEEALRRARIPAFFSRGSARPDPAGRAFLALLSCAAEKLSASRFAEYLSLAQVPLETAAPVAATDDSGNWVGSEPGPEDEMLKAGRGTETEDTNDDLPRRTRTLRGWEKLLVDAAVIGSRERWQRRLAGLKAELELQRDLLEQTDPPRAESVGLQLESLAELEHFALPVIETLDALPAAASWATWKQHLTHLARMALRDPDPVLAILAEFDPMGDVGPASLEEVTEVLSDRLRFLRREPPRRRWGHVFVGPVEEARGREFAVVFLPGLSEGLFPRRALEDPLLLDDFRRALNAALPLRTDRVDQERLRLHIAAGAARDRLIASYSRMDVAEARPRVPSFYALELPRAVQGSLPVLKDFERLAREAAPARLNRPAPRETADAIDDAEYDAVAIESAQAGTPGGARYLIESNTHLARSLRARYTRWRRSWKEADGLITADRGALDALADQRLAKRAWSPSALERFAVCPYQFALAGILRLHPREESAPLEQLDPLTRGALFHAVQFALLQDLRDSGLLPVNRDRLPEALAHADSALDRVAGDYEEQLAPAIPRVWRAEIEDLRTDLRGWLQHAAQNDDDWTPMHFELGFGLESHPGRDPASVREEAELKEGVRLRGSIDLVEMHSTRGVLRVTDHKTGRPLERPPAFVGGGKTLQPVLYALSAAKLLGRPVESGRLFYATQRGEYQQMAVLVNDRARAFLTRFLGNVDGSIADGFLPPAPERDACGRCDYRIVCGPYEEQRSARKDRRDPRMEPLVEIRGMA
jgi:ATP-dependent helicase/nuclease subunit B